MSTGNPWYRFYPALWLGDPALRRCTIAARGLWIDLLCLMHDAEPRGHLVLDGKYMEDQEIAAELATICGTPTHEILALLAELERRNVFSRDSHGTIYSRRMVADTKLDKARAKGGKRGGAIRREQLMNSGKSAVNHSHNKTQKREDPEDTEDTELGVSESPSPTQNHRAPSGDGKYFFEGQTIKLNKPDFDRWADAFHTLDLRAELTGLDAWFQGQPPEKQKRWFHSVPGMLARKHQERLDAQKQHQAEAETPQPEKTETVHYVLEGSGWGECFSDLSLSQPDRYTLHETREGGRIRIYREIT